MSDFFLIFFLKLCTMVASVELPTFRVLSDFILGGA